MTNRIIPDEELTFAEALTRINDVVQHRGVAPELKELVQGLKTISEKISIEFIDQKITATTRVTSRKDLEAYRNDIGESFIMDLKPLLADRKDYIDMLKPMIGKTPVFKEIQQFADFLHQECSKSIIRRPNER